MCTRPINIHYFDEFEKREVYRQVPCMRCEECAFSKQNSWYQRLNEEIKSNLGVPMCWFTLTYDDEHVPKCIDKKTGEFVLSLMRSDVIRWKKICSTRYARALKKCDDRSAIGLRNLHKCKLKWVIVGELGGHTGRPHYHGICIGINRSDFVHYFLRIWVNGCTNRRGKMRPAKITKSRPGEFPAMGRIYHCADIRANAGGLCRYLSKYLVKPADFNWSENSLYKRLGGEKPRVCATPGIGMSYVSRMNDYHLANGDVKKIVDRCYYYDNGFRYALSRYFYNKIFGVGQKIKTKEPLVIIDGVTFVDKVIKYEDAPGVHLRRKIAKYRAKVHDEQEYIAISNSPGVTLEDKARNYFLSLDESLKMRANARRKKMSKYYEKDLY